MSTLPDRRTRKRLATRQRISDVATRLFFERGFDHVTVDEIADAADVGRMTVFNHFPRKEDMFFDQDPEARQVVLDAARNRDPHVAPIVALRLLAHRLVAEERPYIRFGDESSHFVETIAASDALKARARAIRDEMVNSLAHALAASVDQPADDIDAHLAASLLLAAWTVAFAQAHQDFRKNGAAKLAKEKFLSIVDKASTGIETALRDTLYGAIDRDS
ncbi:TetR/AcrR family transcriptional regulator [Jiella mangrovi]|uniref:TetR family transcriptional regulator n=1 Tax=Jiella mangrovi TaxID=2821407 RepID=A0ABS4BIW8_9HYPH|nr:TetR family transcriptional regulator [Jiella mangrovi]MBP0616713.1 TetR family transcriptional regulator [Jiella mangrovi]